MNGLLRDIDIEDENSSDGMFKNKNFWLLNG